MTRDVFEDQMTRLTVLRFPPADMDGYFGALRDIPAGVLEAAVTHAIKTRRDFPVPAELRADADHVAPAVSCVDTRTDADRTQALAEPYVVTAEFAGAHLRLPVHGEYIYDCEVCSDTGWQSFWCGEVTIRRAPWMERRYCGKRGAHGPHEWAQHCGCYATNPTLVSKRAAQQRYADHPQRVA